MEEKSTSNSYQNIINATSIFGFAQLLKIGINVISSKFIALFLGVSGIGLVGILNNTIEIIKSITGFGFQITSIREVAAANAKNDKVAFAKKLSQLQKTSLFIGLFGALFTLIFAPLLSQLTFGNSSNSIWFVALSINFILTSYTNFRVAILQGLQQIKPIAFANVWSSALITIFTIPIYYFFKFGGIVPLILISSVINLLVYFFYTRKVKIIKATQSFSDSFKDSKLLLKAGFLLSINAIFGLICTYLIKLFLNGNGATTHILGLYEVSTAILLSYVGLVFTAMATDFYPRLSTINKDNFQVNDLVNKQIEIGLLLITPLIALFYFLSPLIIETLYTKDFLGVLSILKVGLFAIILKTIVWPFGFVFLAKNENKQYFAQEIVSDLFLLLATIFGYKYFGLFGIGVASALQFALYGIYVYIILEKTITFNLEKNTIKIICFSVFIGLSNCIILYFYDYPKAYFLLSITLILSIIFSINQLNKRIGLMSYYLKFRKKSN